MTRDEAIEKVRLAQQRLMSGGPGWDVLVDQLVALGLLRLEARDETDAVTQAIVTLEQSIDLCCSPLGARRIVDVLVKAGFRITRDR
jgi:hypothetical protein